MESSTQSIIAYQGIPGSFSYEAAYSLFGDKATYVGTTRFTQIGEYLSEKKASHGVLPIENTLVGSIYENYDVISRYALPVTGEIILPIRHHLYALPGVALEEIKKVYSHEKALEQCREFFRTHSQVAALSVASTAHGALKVKEEHDRTQAALASEGAGALYGLSLLRSDLQDFPKNYTRFLLVGGNHPSPRLPTKATVEVVLPHEPGSLVHFLTTLSKQGLNLTKIESRPIPESPFEYRFYLDIESQSPLSAEKISLTSAKNGRILGTYGISTSR